MLRAKTTGYPEKRVRFGDKKDQKKGTQNCSRQRQQGTFRGEKSIKKDRSARKEHFSAKIQIFAGKSLV